MNASGGLRSLRAADLAAVLALNNAALPAVNRLDHAQLAALFATACHAVVAGGATPTAFLLALPTGLAYDSLNYRWFSARYTDFVYVDRVVVDPSEAGRGTGRALYRSLMAACAPPAARICCEVNLRPRNEASLCFHAALGFAEVGQLDTDGGAKRVSLLVRETAPRRAG